MSTTHAHTHTQIQCTHYAIRHIKIKIKLNHAAAKKILQFNKCSFFIFQCSFFIFQCSFFIFQCSFFIFLTNFYLIL